jgi:hypothetical protein
MDLWADLNGDSVLAGTAGSIGRPRGKRRLTERVILSQLRDWLLEYYVRAYCRSLATTRIFRRCYWIDTLGVDPKSPSVDSTLALPSSKGRKKGTIQPVPPALQLITTLSQELMQDSQPITLYGLLLTTGGSRRKETQSAKQLGMQNISMLELTTSESEVGSNGSYGYYRSRGGNNGESAILHTTWLEAAPFLLNETGQSPAIFLLNLLSPTLFSANDLAPLYQRPVPTELCLLLSHKRIGALLLAASTIPTQATALNALLLTDRWRSLPTSSEEQEQAVRGFMDLLIASLQRHFQLPIQPITFPIVTGPATVEPAAYTLLFATRRQDSLLCMNDAVCTYRWKVEQESYRGVLGEEWFASQQQARQKQVLQQLHQRLRQQGQAQRIRRWPDLRQHVLVSEFGHFTLYDYDTIILQLLHNGEVRCAWRRSLTSPDEERVPGNDDTLVWRL